MAASTGTGAFTVEDFAEYLLGTWKRNLEWRHFGGTFEHLRSSNTIVVIDEQAITTTGSGERVRNLRWSFGVNHRDVRFGYSMKFIPDTTGTFMQWQYGGNSCHGIFRPVRNVAILNFYLASSTVTITYRAMDNDTMAVCIVEVNDLHTPTIQYGNMFRLKPALYREPSASGRTAGTTGTAAGVEESKEP